MKHFFRAALPLSLALVIGLVGCSKDPAAAVDENEIAGGKATIRLRVLNAGGTTRAAVGEHPAETEEAEFANEIYLFIFKADGTLELSADDVELDGTNKTEDTFTITTGKKYFYIFSDPAGVLDFSNVATMTRLEFETSFVEEALQNVIDNEGLETADGTDFVNGTLWGEEINVTTDGTFTVNIGRIVAKVTMDDFGDNNGEMTAAASGPLKGTFSDASWRVGSVPIRTHLVGQYAGTIIPPAANHGAVTSAVHNEYWEDSSNADLQNPLFANYETFLSPGLNNWVYVNENTSARLDASGPASGGQLFYGNTTYIRFMVTYTPHEDNLRSADNYLLAGDIDNVTGVGKDGTFWTARIKGVTYLFDGDPRITHDGVNEIDDLNSGTYKLEIDTDANNVKCYSEGVNYYRFPIRDYNETGLVNQCRVLRNHYYEITVNSIKNLGEPGADPDDPKPPVEPPVPPIDPIEEEVDVDFIVEVLKWAKIEQGEDL